MTLPVGLTNFQAMYSTDYVGMIAAVIITIIPSIVVYILLHKQIMEGMVAGKNNPSVPDKQEFGQTAENPFSVPVNPFQSPAWQFRSDRL